VRTQEFGAPRRSVRMQISTTRHTTTAPATRRRRPFAPGRLGLLAVSTVALASLLVTACAAPSRPSARSERRPSKSVVSPPATPSEGPTTVAGPPAQAAAPTASSPTAPGSSSGAQRQGIEVTVYYTAVESFHSGSSQTVRGCTIRDCAFGNSDLGTYPRSFVQAVQDEGTGRITSGASAGRYLNWSYDVGYWLDTIPSDSYGAALVPMVTAAADSDVAHRGQRFRLVAPLLQDDGEPLADPFASQILGATWTVNDEFTPGLGGAAHIDIYIGEEDRVDFTGTSPKYMTLHNATMLVLP